MIREFPSNQFNHVILCVPMVKDTMWLECTSQSIPVGHIGDGNEDREALLITPEGGVVVKTPRSRADENRQTRAASVRIGLKGEADVTVRTTVTGNQQDRIRLALAEASPANRERWIIEDLQVPNVSLRSQAVEGLDSRSLAVSVSLAFSITKFAVPSGERFFFQPNLLERRTDIPPEVSQRLSPIRLGYAYCDIDSVIYHIPGVFTPEALPRPVALSSSFGRYLTETTPLGDTALVFRRTLEISQRIIPPEQYNVYRRFFQRVANADRTQVVLRRR